MAQTKRKRRSKHRGTPGGSVQVRGKAGSKIEGQSRPAKAKGQQRARAPMGPNRFDQPPTWRSSINRAVIASAVFFVAIVLLFKRPPAAAAGLAAFMLLFYVPMGFYTDRFIYNRRQAKIVAARQAKGKPKDKDAG